MFLPPPIMPIIAIIVVIVAALSGGVAAESALPGDALYSVKVGVNENIRSAFTPTVHGKATWNVHRAERRLEEVETLVDIDSLSQDEAEESTANFRAHIATVKRDIESLRASGDIEASVELSTELEAMLQAHASVLSRIAILNAGTHDALKSLLSSVESESRASGQLADTAAQMTVAGSASGSGIRIAAAASMKSAEHKIAEVRSFIDAKASVATPASLTDANARLQVAQSSLDAAKAQWDGGAYADAFASVRSSLHIAQEAKLLLEWGASGRKNSSASSSPASSTSSSVQSSGSGSSEGKVNSGSTLRTQAQARIDSAAKKIDEVRANIATRAGSLSLTATVQATAKLDSAASNLSQARAKFALSQYVEARDGADASFQMAIDAQTQVEQDTH